VRGGESAGIVRKSSETVQRAGANHSCPKTSCWVKVVSAEKREIPTKKNSRTGRRHGTVGMSLGRRGGRIKFAGV